MRSRKLILIVAALGSLNCMGMTLPSTADRKPEVVTLQSIPKYSVEIQNFEMPALTISNEFSVLSYPELKMFLDQETPVKISDKVLTPVTEYIPRRVDRYWCGLNS